MRRMISAVLCLATAGCLRVQPVEVIPRHAPFVPSEYEPYDRPGTGSITGQAFLKTRGGEVRFCAGEPVSLNPVTTYSREWWNVVVLGRRELAPPDSRAERYHRTTIADAEGRFQFRNLPAGEYLAACYVEWEVPGARSLEATGGWAGAQVKVENGTVAEPILIDVRRFGLALSAIPAAALPPPGPAPRRRFDPNCLDSQRLMGLCTQNVSSDGDSVSATRAEPRRNGAYVVLGGGFASLDCRDCGDRRGGTGAWLGIGKSLSPRNSLGVEGRAWISDEETWYATLVLALTAYLNDRSGLFATTGIGAAFAHGAGTESGLGVLGTLGYDFPVSRAVAFTPYIGFDFTLGGIDGTDFNNVNIGGAIRLH